ncbi:MAG: nitronate monooxygenase [Rhodanobacteraceae bacterium]
MPGHRDREITDLFGIDLPVIQAPMAGATSAEMVIAVSEAGGLGSLPGAMYSSAQLRDALAAIRAKTHRAIGVNFFCHASPTVEPERLAAWRERLLPYYAEFGVDPDAADATSRRMPFDESACAVVEEFRPDVVSFHFGLPPAALVERVKRAGAKVVSSATTVAEARWLEARGVDAIIAMGAEAGGHRGSFLGDGTTAPIGTLALVPQIADAVAVPVIAAGGIVDRRGVVAARALGASAVQVGTAYLFTPEARIHAVHRRALGEAERTTALTNVFSGRAARGIVNRLMRDLGALCDLAPPFPAAADAVAPLRLAAEAAGRDDFSPLWAGQAFPLARAMSSAELTRKLGTDGA